MASQGTDLAEEPTSPTRRPAILLALVAAVFASMLALLSWTATSVAVLWDELGFGTGGGLTTRLGTRRCSGTMYADLARFEALQQIEPRPGPSPGDVIRRSGCSAPGRLLAWSPLDRAAEAYTWACATTAYELQPAVLESPEHAKALRQQLLSVYGGDPTQGPVRYDDFDESWLGPIARSNLEELDRIIGD